MDSCGQFHAFMKSPSEQFLHQLPGLFGPLIF